MTTCNHVTWEFLRPAADINRIANPSFEFDINGINPIPTTTVTRDTGHHWSGAASLGAADAINNPQWYSTAYQSVIIGGTYYFKARILGVAGEIYNLTIFTLPGPVPVAFTFFTATGDWQTETFAFAAPQLYVTYGISAGFLTGSPFYVDGLEIVSNATATYLDGDQIDCQWSGIPHASSSFRLGTRRGGGIPIDFPALYGFQLGSESGTGLRPMSYLEIDKGDLPGTQTTGLKVERRVWQLGGIIYQPTFEDWRTARNEFISEIAPTTYTRINGAPQPVRWRYTGSQKTLQIDGYYEGGLDVGITADDLSYERVALRILSNDHPQWYELPQDGQELDYQDTPSYTHAWTLARRDGVWETVQDTGTGNYTAWAVAVSGDGMIYYGGDWTQIDGDATLQYCARFNPLIDTWEALAAGAVTGVVRALLPLPDGRIMLGGEFTDVGDPNGDYVVIYDPATDAFTSLNTNPLNGLVRGLALDPTTGDIIIVGDFTTDAIPTTLNRVARWTGGAANFTANGTTLDAAIYGVGVRRNGQIIVTGTHTEKISACDPGSTTWYEVGNVSGANNDGRCVFVDPDDDTVFVGGAWTQFDGETANGIIQCGTISSGYVQWVTLGSGVAGGGVRGIAKHPIDGSYRIVGVWTDVGDCSINGKILRWTGSAFANELINLLTTLLTGVFCVAIGANGDEWYGGTELPAGILTAGHTTITQPDGASPTPPVFSFRKIGSAGVARLYGVENFTKENARITFDGILLLDDETIEIDCYTEKITSSIGRAIAPIGGTSPRSMRFLAGDNDVFLLISTNTTVIARAYWSTNFWSVDAAEDVD